MQAGEDIAPALPLGHVWAQQLAGRAAGQAGPLPQGQVSMATLPCPVLKRMCRHALATVAQNQNKQGSTSGVDFTTSIMCQA